MAASLLAAFRHLGLPDGDLREAAIKSCGSGFAAPRPAHPRTTQDVAAPARRLALDPRPHQNLAGHQDTADPDLTPSRHPDDHESTPIGAWNPAHRRDSRTTTLPTDRKTMIEITRL